MDKPRRRRLGWRANTFATALIIALFFSGSALFAQSSIPERLPPSTVCYVEWHGTSGFASAAAKNHLVQLLGDPAFSPLWIAVANNLSSQQRTGPTGGPSVADLLSLIENPVAAGIAETPALPKPAAGANPSPMAMFAVYDATGKTDLLRKLEAQDRGKNADVTVYDFGDTTVQDRKSGPNDSYAAQTPGFFLIANRKQLIEDLITRFGRAEKPASSLAQLPEYQSMRRYVDPGAALDFFCRVPDLNRLPAFSQNKAPGEAVRSLHLEKIHAAGGSVSFAGEATRVQGAILGDTSPGGIFDLAGPSSAAFLTEPAVARGPVFQMSRVDLAAGYKLGRGAVIGNLNADQTANVTTFETGLQNYLGMPIAGALGLFTGELATTTLYSDDGSTQQLFAAGIERPADVLRMLRAIVGPVTVSEDTFGPTTYLDLAYPYRDPATGMQRRRFYYLAVTPRMVVAAPRKALLREAAGLVSGTSGGAPAGGIFANAEFVQMRSLLPKKLSGLSGADIGRIPWEKYLANLENEWDRATKQSGSQPPGLMWLRGIKPEAIPRHLSMSISGWWKDSSGVYFDSYLQ